MLVAQAFDGLGFDPPEDEDPLPEADLPPEEVDEDADEDDEDEDEPAPDAFPEVELEPVLDDPLEPEEAGVAALWESLFAAALYPSLR